MKNMIVFLGLLLCLCVSSWGACTSGTISCCSALSAYCSQSSSNFNYLVYTGGGGCEVILRGNNGYEVGRMCKDGTQNVASWGTTNCIISGKPFGGTYVVCDTQAEADSVAIAQKCTSGTMIKDTINSVIFDACKNGPGLIIAFNDPITGVRNSSIGYYIVTANSADLLDEATYNHLAALACTEVSLYRGVLNGKYVYWYSTDPEPAGVVNVVRIK